MSFLPVDEQLAIIRRGVEKIVPEEELAAKLTKSRETGKPLRVKYGIDPTGIDVHLGHTVPLRKLRQFQELGHQAVIIIGNYTALVGDPSGRDHARSQKLTAEEVEANAKDYLTQVGKVVDLSRAEVHRNGDWFGKMSFADVIGLCGKVTVAQLLTRDDFAKRYAASTPIFLHECLYPVMQAWDSVEIKSDIELGGTEQLYSFMLARDLQRDQHLPQQIGVMSPILVGLDGVRRMGKSLGNYIGIAESPYDMMKKFMQLPDAFMKMYFELLTEIPLAEVDAILAGHPKEAKIRLATAVIAGYHHLESVPVHRILPAETGHVDSTGGNTSPVVPILAFGAVSMRLSIASSGQPTPVFSSAAKEAADRWQREVGGGELPLEIPTVSLSLKTLAEQLPHHAADLAASRLAAPQLLKTLGLTASTSEAARLIAQGGVSIIRGDQTSPVSNSKATIPLESDLLVKAGKKRIVRLSVGE